MLLLPLGLSLFRWSVSPSMYKYVVTDGRNGHVKSNASERSSATYFELYGHTKKTQNQPDRACSVDVRFD